MILDLAAPIVLLAAVLLDAVLGDPAWLWRAVPHPVVIIGNAIASLERALNRPQWSGSARRMAGLGCVVAILAGAVIIAFGLRALAEAVAGPLARYTVEAVMAGILLAQRSLFEHVARVRDAFADGGLSQAREAVSMIVGRDPNTLDAAGVSRAAIETTAENFSDGVIAPAFWFLLLGLPGMLAYKVLNTADSMIGHRNARYADFGWAAARLDDLANLVPARLSAVLIALAAIVVRGNPFKVVAVAVRDAGKHKSPNAGWPEAAMAATLGLALAGPRVYGGVVTDDPWLNGTGREDAQLGDITRALEIYVAALSVHAALVLVIAMGCVSMP